MGKFTKPSVDAHLGNGPGSRPCPFCAEPILVEARKCKHCQSMLADEQGRPFVVGVAGKADSAPVVAPSPAKASLLALLLANLFCPGLGTWRQGQRLRAFLILAGLLVCVMLYVKEALPIYQQTLNLAGKMNPARIAAQMQAKLDAIIWYEVGLALFAYSFLDVILVFYGSARKEDSGNRV